jgi:hypothetical protein
MSHATNQRLAPLVATRKQGTYLPRPPDDRERDLYLGPQHRWVVPVSFLG